MRRGFRYVPTAMATLSSASRRIAAPLRRARRRRLVEGALGNGLPQALERPLHYLADGRLTADEAAACEAVERLRQSLAARAGETVSIYYSPKPGSAGTVATAEVRPDHGEVQTFDLERIANETSVDKASGEFMYLAARGSRARTIVELGACAGIASAYLCASGCESFTGVEGSAELAAIAEANAQSIKPDAVIVNALFDDALDALTFPDGIDAVWIDGHHEKVATIHYYQRLQPHLNDGALVFFDDIRWSQDMLEGWEMLQADEGFSDTVDLNLIGVGIWNGRPGSPRTWDLAALRGRTTVGTPAGWR